MNISTERKPITLLFRPFVYIAGGQALGLGLAAILLAGLIGFASHTHFDGVLDVHIAAGRIGLFLSEGVVDWLCLSVVLLALGKMISSTSFRLIDLFGTQALARWPMLLMALLGFTPGYERFLQHLVHQLTTTGKPDFLSPDLPAFIFVTCMTLPIIVWVVVLMYNAYSISCNVRGAKAVGTFIGGLILAEILSKFAISAVFHAMK